MDGIMQHDWDGLDDFAPDDGAVDLEALKAETARLAAMTDVEYELSRVAAAKRFNVRPGYFDKARRAARPKAEAEAGGTSPVEEIEPWDGPVDGAALAADLRARLVAHVVFERATDADALAVWLLAAGAMDVWGLFPKVLITAPERACGKTTLLNVIGACAPRALAASNATPAAIFRGIELWKPTLLLDEIDTWLPEAPELRGVINSGHERDQAFVLRCVGDDHTPRRFSTWCPMVLSGIGRPADTIVSRSLVVSLRRRLPSETVQRRPVDLRDKMLIARRKAARWVADSIDRLRASQVEPPEAGDDRRRDNFTPLYRVAAELGGDWPRRIEAAYLAEAEADEAEDSAGVMLLRDLMEIAEADGWPRFIQSETLVNRLTADDAKPWHEWRRGKPATVRTLAKLLAPYGVRPKGTKQPGGRVAKCYHVADIREAAARYCVQSATPLPPCNQRENPVSNPLPRAGGSGLELRKDKQFQRGSGVADTEALDPEMWR